MIRRALRFVTGLHFDKEAAKQPQDFVLQPMAFSELWDHFEDWVGGWLPYAVVVALGLIIGYEVALVGSQMPTQAYNDLILGRVVTEGTWALRFQLLFTLWLCSLIACLFAYLALVTLPWLLKGLQVIWLVVSIIGCLAALATYFSVTTQGDTSGLGPLANWLPWLCLYALWLVFQLPGTRRRLVIILAVTCTAFSLLIAFQQLEWGPIIFPAPLLEPNSSTLPLGTA